MNGQFKSDGFDKETLKEFANDLEQKGISASMIWKKGNKIVEEDNEKTNFFSLEINENWFFRQVKDKGYVRFKHLNSEQEKIVVNLLKEYNFYTDPNWGLGIGLVIVYLFIELYISDTQGIIWLMPVIMSCCLLVVLFLWIAYRRATEKISESTYKACMFFGVPAYLFTAIGSLLAIPLFKSINQYHLKYKILNASKD